MKNLSFPTLLVIFAALAATPVAAQAKGAISRAQPLHAVNPSTPYRHLQPALCNSRCRMTTLLN